MAVVLAYTSPARGHLYPFVAIAQELHRRGHDVVIRTLTGDVPMLQQLGLAAEPIDPRIEAITLDDWRRRTAPAAVRASAATFARRAEVDASDLADAVARHRPDAVLVDTNSWGAQAAAEAWGGAWASVLPFPAPLPSADVPPFGLGLRPGTGLAARLRDAAIRPALLGALQRATLPAYDAVRERLGLRPLRTVAALYRHPPTTLYLTAEPFDYPRRDWPPGFVAVGPCDWDPPATAPDWLADVDRPIALVTTSTEYQHDERLVRAALTGLADTGLYVVATTASPAVPTGPWGEVGRVERFVPHSLVLGRAAVAVTHGGMGATQKAVLRGVPVCAVPFGRDQLEVARRVEVSGAGTRLPARRLTANRLRQQVNDALRHAPGAARVGAALAAAGGAQAAADAVEARLLGSTS